MGIDSNIYAQFQPKQLTMADMIRQQQSIQEGQQQIQGGALDLQHKQLSLQNQQSLADLYRQGKDASDPDMIRATDASDPLNAGARNLARARGDEQRALAAKNLQQAMIGIAKDTQEHIQQSGLRAGAAARAALASPDPSTYAPALQSILTSGMADMQPREADDERTAQMKVQGLQRQSQILQALPTMTPEQQRATLMQIHQAAFTIEDWQKLDAEKEKDKDRGNKWTGLHPVLGPDGKPSMVQVNEAGDTRIVPGLKPIPPKATTTGTTMGGMSLPAGSSTDDALAQIPAQYRNLVKSLGEYRAAPNDALPRGKERLAIMNMVQQVYPNWNVNDAGQAHKFLTDLASSSPTSAGGQVQAINNIGEHLSIMLDANKKLGGFNGIASPLNYLKVAGESMTGDKDLARWDSGISFFTAEGQKLVKGGLATEGEVKEALSHLGAAKSPEARSAALGTAAEFFYGKIKGLEDRMRKLTQNQGAPNGLLTAKAQQNFQQAFKESGIEQPQMLAPSGAAYTNTGIQNNQRSTAPTQPANQQRLAPADAAKLPSGTRFVGLDGVERVKH